MKKVVILGSTGSIGKQTLEVVKKYPDELKVIGLAANNNINILAKQAKEFNVKNIAIFNINKYKDLKSKLSNKKIYAGQEGVNYLATLKDADIIVSSIVGTAGIISTYEAIKNKKNIAIANKESLVLAGDILMPLIKKNKSIITPIDSEHNAIWNLLKIKGKDYLEKIILTASGGPFFKLPKEKFNNITIKQALSHPTWNMGVKISIDSATMLNKGFEVIEAHHLFDISYNDIDVVIHPESIVHSMVKQKDGFLYAQIGPHDMKFPILSALLYDKNFENRFKPFDITKVEKLSFYKPDYRKFPLLRMSFEIGKEGGILPAVFAAADDIAINKFLKKEISFVEIYSFIRKIVNKYAKKNIRTPSIDDILYITKELKKIHM